MEQQYEGRPKLENIPDGDSMHRENPAEKAKLAELNEIFLTKYFDGVYREDRDAYLDATASVKTFSDGLIVKYGQAEAIKRRLFHVLGGSGALESESPYFDFEGDDSIERFIREFSNFSRAEKVASIKKRLEVYLDKMSADPNKYEEKYSEHESKVRAFEAKITHDQALDLNDFLVWHLIIGSSPGQGRNYNEMELDTPNRDIERFFNKLIITPTD